MFERFPSLTRFSHGWTITEKLDGTNAAILIVYAGDPAVHEYLTEHPDTSVASVGEFFVFAQSRSKLITPGKSTDNHGFARYVQDNAEEIVAKLGEGRHFGEWVGKGINKRHYDLPGKQFALFNTHRWTDADLPEQVTVVPVLAGGYMEDPGAQAVSCMYAMKAVGSAFAPGFMNPEGVVMYHGPSKTTFKKTYDYDEQGKWAEKANG